MMRIFILLFICLIIIADVKAQSSGYIISGKVIDSRSHEPLSNVNISSNDTAKITTSITGEFKLYINKFPASLTVSHVGFFTKTIKLTPRDTFILVYMEQNALELTGITINAPVAENIITNKRVSILDYNFIEDNIILLVKEFGDRDRWLWVTDLDGKKLSSIKAPPKTSQLAKDCLGHVIALTETEAFPIALNKEEIRFQEPLSIPKYTATLKPCIIALDQRYYFNQYLNGRQNLLYYYIKAGDIEPTRVREITDELMVRRWLDEPNFQKMQEAAGIKYDPLFAEKFMFKPVYAPLLKINDSAYIFNYLDGQIEHIGKEKEPYRYVPITFHNRKDWKKEMYVDEMQNNVYAFFEKNGIYTLGVVSLETGLVERFIPIPEMKYIDHIRVYDDRLFFIYQEPDKDNFRNLYRLRLN